MKINYSILMKFIERIKLKMFLKNGMTQKELAKETGINFRTLQRRFDNPEYFRFYEIIKICDVLGVELMVR